VGMSIEGRVLKIYFKEYPEIYQNERNRLLDDFNNSFQSIINSTRQKFSDVEKNRPLLRKQLKKQLGKIKNKLSSAQEAAENAKKKIANAECIPQSPKELERSQKNLPEVIEFNNLLKQKDQIKLKLTEIESNHKRLLNLLQFYARMQQENIPREAEDNLYNQLTLKQKVSYLLFSFAPTLLVNWLFSNKTQGLTANNPSINSVAEDFKIANAREKRSETCDIHLCLEENKMRKSVKKTENAHLESINPQTASIDPPKTEVAYFDKNHPVIAHNENNADKTNKAGRKFSIN
jgi:hypothetical protein